MIVLDFFVKRIRCPFKEFASAGFASSSLPGLGDQVAQQIIASLRPR
jgi:hypothetical protein